jgi:serine/threonine-protein kinase RsbW
MDGQLDIPNGTIELSKNGLCFTACFLSAQNNVSKATEAATKWMKEVCIDEEEIDNVSLVVAEALNNVIEHAYTYAEDGRIELYLNHQNGQLTVKIVDQGAAFDGPPEKKEMGDHGAMDIMDLPEGGFGWFMIQTLCKEIAFVRENNRNNLTLVLTAAIK